MLTTRHVQETREVIAYYLLSTLPKTITLKHGHVHLWWTPMDLKAQQTTQLYQFLSTDERERAEGFRFQQHRNFFIAARGALRAILARYLNTEPGRLCFNYNQWGKPSLDRKHGDAELRFNLSHSEGLVCYAIACGREVGVDIEFVRPNVNVIEVAEKYLSPREINELYRTPPNNRQELFLAYWTCREAYTKATGVGLSLPLNKIEISFFQKKTEVLVKTVNNPNEASRWLLLSLDSPSGYVGTVAVEGPDFRIKNYICRI